MTDDDQRWRAVEIGDTRSAGTFLYGREADGLYHSPVCRNRPDNRDGIRFFDTPGTARHQGFKACRDCHHDQAEWLTGAGRWM